MRTIIDLTEDETGPPPGDGTLPEIGINCDDEIEISIGLIELKMTFSQFENLRQRMNAWHNNAS